MVWQRLQKKIKFRPLTILRLFSVLVLALVLISGIIGWALLGTEQGRVWLTHSAIDFINRSGSIKVEAAEPSTPTLGQWTIKSINLMLEDNQQLHIKDLALSWQPAKLWQRELVIDNLHLGTLDVQILQDGQKKTTSKKFNLNDLKKLNLPPFHIKHVGVDRLSVKTGEPSTDEFLRDVKLQGEIEWLDQLLHHARFNFKTLSDISTGIQLSVSEKTSGEFRLVGSIQEKSNGFLGRKIRLPEGQPIAVDFQSTATYNDEGLYLDINKFKAPFHGREIALDGKVALNNTLDQLDINHLAIKTDDEKHSLNGNWSKESINFSLKLNEFPLDLLTPWQDYLQTGTLTADIDLQGNSASPTISAEADVTSTYQSLPLSLELSAMGNTDAMRIEKLKGHWGATHVNAQGKVDWQTDETDIRLTLKEFNVNRLKAFDIAIPKNLQATIADLKAHLTGDIKNPNGTVTTMINGRYLKLPFKLHSRLKKQAQTLSFSSTTISLPEGDISLKGQANIKSLHGKITLEAESIPVELLTLTGVTVPKELEAHASGQFYIEGDFRKPAISGQATMEGQYSTIPFKITGKGSHVKNTTEVESLTLSTLKKQLLTMQATVAEKHLKGELNVNRLPTEILSKLGWKLPSGELNADFQVSGLKTSPSLEGALRYVATLPDLNAGEEKGSQLMWELAASTEADHYRFASHFTQGDNPYGDMVIKIPTAPYFNYFNASKNTLNTPIPLKASVSGKFDLEASALFINPVLHRLSGKVKTDVDVNGTIEKPIIKGHLEFEKSRYENPVTGTRIDSIFCTINADQHHVGLSKCSATDGDRGKYTLHGDIDLPEKDASGRVNVTLNAEQAAILNRPDIDSEASGQITLSGDFESLLAKGQVSITPLNVSIAGNASSDIPKIRVKKVDSIENMDKAKSKNTTLPDVRLDLLILAEQQADLRGRGLEAELKGKVRVRGTLKKPRYDGRIKTIRGVFKVFGKQFELKQGEVTIVNDTIGFDVEGVYDKEGQRILAKLNGTTDEFDLTLNAEPPMPEDEIMSFIIFGKSLEAITPFEAIQLASAVQSLRGGGGSSFDPIGKTRELLGVDTLSIEQESLESGEKGINVGLGKYINEKVYLELERTPNPSQPWRGTLQIEITSNIQLKTSTGGKSGIEGLVLKWKKDY